MKPVLQSLIIEVSGDLTLYHDTMGRNLEEGWAVVSTVPWDQSHEFGTQAARTRSVLVTMAHTGVVKPPRQV